MQAEGTPPSLLPQAQPHSTSNSETHPQPGCKNLRAAPPRCTCLSPSSPPAGNSLRVEKEKRPARGEGGRQQNIQKLNIFLRVCISWVSLHVREGEVKGEDLLSCIVAGILSRQDLTDFLHCFAWLLYFEVILSTFVCPHIMKILW